MLGFHLKAQRLMKILMKALNFSFLQYWKGCSLQSLRWLADDLHEGPNCPLVWSTSTRSRLYLLICPNRESPSKLRSINYFPYKKLGKKKNPRSLNFSVILFLEEISTLTPHFFWIVNYVTPYYLGKFLLMFFLKF